jgi:predicted enzyme related to lactoylglutathione lyase
MPDLPTSNPKQFVQGVPVFHIPDVMATATFYRDVLGFTWDFGDEEYSVVWRDNSAIHFVKGDTCPSGVHIFQWVQDIDSYYAEIVDRGATVAGKPEDQAYGLREFRMRDNNGIEIVFSQDIE